MILVDTGPLVALLNEHDPNHAICIDAIKQLQDVPMLTTWPCLTEAMYFLYRAKGYNGQAALWRMLDSRDLEVFNLDEADRFRMSVLMAKYRDTPMDFADASLVVAAERLGSTAVFTLDRDFYVYRLTNGSALTVIP